MNTATAVKVTKTLQKKPVVALVKRRWVGEPEPNTVRCEVTCPLPGCGHRKKEETEIHAARWLERHLRDEHPNNPKFCRHIDVRVLKKNVCVAATADKLRPSRAPIWSYYSGVCAFCHKEVFFRSVKVPKSRRPQPADFE